MKVFEYLDRRGNGVFSEWRERLQPPQRAALDVKVDLVRKAGQLPPNLLRGPVSYRGRSYPHTWKLTVNAGGIAMRPLVCPGPIADDEEWTILVAVVEVGNRYPDGVFEQAENRRDEILAEPSRRQLIP